MKVIDLLRKELLAALLLMALPLNYLAAEEIASAKVCSDCCPDPSTSVVLNPEGLQYVVAVIHERGYCLDALYENPVDDQRICNDGDGGATTPAFFSYPANLSWDEPDSRRVAVAITPELAEEVKVENFSNIVEALLENWPADAAPADFDSQASLSWGVPKTSQPELLITARTLVAGVTQNGREVVSLYQKSRRGDIIRDLRRLLEERNLPLSLIPAKADLERMIAKAREILGCHTIPRNGKAKFGSPMFGDRKCGYRIDAPGFGDHGLGGNQVHIDLHQPARCGRTRIYIENGVVKVWRH